MTSLRILMFTTFYPPYSFGGDAIGVQRMARALAARGHRVTVVHDEDAHRNLGGPPPSDAARSDSGDGVRRIGLSTRFGLLSNLLVQQSGRPVLHGPQLARIAAEGWDIVWHNNISLVGGPGLIDYADGLRIYEAHEHWLVCPTHVLWRYGRERCDGRDCLRCVVSYHRPPQLWRNTGYLNRQLDKIDLIIAKSRFSRDMHASFGLRQQMEVLPYFLPPLPAAETGPDAPVAKTERPYYLFVGRLEKIKGLQDVFPAMDRFPEADLVILGDGDYAETLKAQAAGNPRIRFLGRMAPEELNAWYRGAEALIVPSVCYETFGIILIEAFRLGTPVIARRLGPFPEIVETAGAGLMFETAEELETAMRTITTEPGLRARLGANARAAFETTWAERPVLEAYGATLARAAHAKGDRALARALDAGAFETGAADTGAVPRLAARS